MRTDPSDTGGLFVGRRPGTAPVRYRDLPEGGSAGRRRADGLLANAVLALMVFVNLLFWGPIPAGALWLASQVQYWTDSVSLGIATGFGVLLAVLFGALSLLKRLDGFWVLVRRAAGHDQRQGVIGKVFASTAAVGALLFAAWFLLVAGPGPSLAPTG
ncbi:hypothetical protein [Conexibacter sp. SYSU D00693]|uniref:hypothetical protein n=1 Tax=Conexibacter sp. SYSU D00693 TaxID=2812560 RepID=UPI00196AEAA4|nr:hypothetical protein [Conexibacter sp. SYSU D00693]